MLDGVIAVGKGASAIADVWQTRRDEYASYTASRRAAAMLVDVSLELIPIVTEVTGGIVGIQMGARVGAVVMGAAESFVPLVGPAVGIATGSIVGGAIGGVVGNSVGRGVGNTISGYIEEHWREDIIDCIDEHLTQPVTKAINQIKRTYNPANHLFTVLEWSR